MSAPGPSNVASKTDNQWFLHFGNPDPNLHDIVLVVEKKMFFCSKKTLATHSPYFNTMFFGEFMEKGKKEIELNDPANADQFNSFLMIIHGVNFANENNVEGLLHLSSIWQTQVVKDQCEEFLKNDSRRSPEEKFKLSMTYGLEDLKKTVINSFKSKTALHNIIPENVMDLDHATMGMILQKTLELLSFRISPEEIRSPPRKRSESRDLYFRRIAKEEAHARRIKLLEAKRRRLNPS